MARLIDSSDPGAVEREQALNVLAERAVLATAVCREFLAAGPTYLTRRCNAAYGLYRSWLAQHDLNLLSDGYRDVRGIREQMQIPEGDPEADKLADEIEVADRVSGGYERLNTADTRSEFQGDQENLTVALQSWQSWEESATK